MKIPNLPQMLRISQLPVCGAIITGVAVLGMTGVIPAAHSALISACILAVLAAAAFLWSGSNLLTLIFLLYSFLVFVVAYPAEYQEEGATLFLIALVGFSLGRTIDKFKHPPAEADSRILPSKARIPPVLILGLIVKFCTLVSLISSYGLRGFYSGQYMAEAVKNYAQGSSNVLLTAAGYLGTILCVAGVGIYVARGKPSRFLLGFTLLGMPMLSLGRSDIIFGAICLAYIFRGTIKIWHIAALASLGLFCAVFIGGLRQSELGGAQSKLSTLGAIVGELSVSQCVRFIADDIHKNGISGGVSLIGPLVTMPIPRAIYPDKPELTAARIMMKYRPFDAESGFYLAPTIFGDWLYNFGDPGVLIISALLGLMIRRIDKGELSFFGVVFSYAIFTILRNNTAQSFLFVFACFAVRELNRFRIASRQDTAPSAPQLPISA